MGVIELILIGVQGISTLLNNPKIGGSSVRMDEASELLGMLATLIEEGDDAYEDLKAFTEEVKEMAERGVGPTPTQWSNMRAREQAAYDRLQAVKRELLGEEEEEDIPNGTTPPDPAPAGGPQPAAETETTEPVSETEPTAPEDTQEN